MTLLLLAIALAGAAAALLVLGDSADTNGEHLPRRKETASSGHAR